MNMAVHTNSAFIRHARPASGERALTEHRAKASDRFNIRCGDQWLHWSGGFLTDKRSHGWIGNEAQGKRALSVFTPAAGGSLERTDP